MARKCKVLDGDHCLAIENQVNNWLRDNEGVEILSLHYQRTPHLGHAVLILYEDNPIVPQTPDWLPLKKLPYHPNDPFYVPTPTCEAIPC